MSCLSEEGVIFSYDENTFELSKSGLEENKVSILYPSPVLFLRLIEPAGNLIVCSVGLMEFFDRELKSTRKIYFSEDYIDVLPLAEEKLVILTEQGFYIWSNGQIKDFTSPPSEFKQFFLSKNCSKSGIFAVYGQVNQLGKIFVYNDCGKLVFYRRENCTDLFFWRDELIIYNEGRIVNFCTIGSEESKERKYERKKLENILNMFNSSREGVTEIFASKNKLIFSKHLPDGTMVAEISIST